MLKLYDYQRDAVDAVINAYRGGTRRPAISMATGCHARGQWILMADGTIKEVTTIRVGDELMGPDSFPRTVQELFRGHGELVRIVPVKGDPWTVNLDHVLTLQRTKKHEGDALAGEVVDVTVREYLTWSSTKKHLYKLFRSYITTFLRSPNTKLAIDPYSLGMILGDGSLSIDGRIGVSKPDPEIRRACESLAEEFGLALRETGLERDKCPTYWFRQPTAEGSRKGFTHGGNRLAVELKELGLLPVRGKERFIPDSYKTASWSDRLEILAGLLDTDGHLGHSGFDYGTKSAQLADDVAFVARSIGLAAYVSQRTKGLGAGHYRVSISGDLSVVPTRIPRKRANKRLQVKNVLRTGFRVEPAGEGAFYGFRLDQDGRYLLQDFTVTHNSGKTICFGKVIDESQERSLVIAHRKEIIEQAAQKMGYIGIPHTDVGIVMADVNQFDRPIVVASIQTIANPKRLAQLGRFGLVVIDEAHHASSPSYVNVLRMLGVGKGMPTKSLGVSATWDRADGVGFEDVFDEIVYTIGIEHLIASGHLADITALRIETELDISGVPSDVHGDWRTEALSQKIEDSNYADTMAEAVATHASDRISLVFAPNVRTADLYRDALIDAGIPAAAVNGNTPKSEREQSLADLRAGRVRAIVNCGVFTEGTDIPIVNCVVMGRPTQSRALYQQMAGRGLRLYPGKENCLILDLVNNVGRNTLQNVASLMGRDPAKQKKTIGSVREWLEEEPIAQAGLGLADDSLRSIGKKFLLKAKPIDLIDRKKLAWLQIDEGVFSIPAGEHGQIVLAGNDQGLFDVTRYDGRNRTREVIGSNMDIGYAQGVAESTVIDLGVRTLANPKAGWRRKKEPATEKQLNAMVRWKISFDPDTITKREASALLDQAITRANLRRSDWQEVRDAG